jgi:tetratricopeptide (TPR) repeat protein
MSARKSRRVPARQAVTPPDRRSTWLVFSALLLVTLVVYAPAWHGGPIWDDDAHLTRVDLRSLHGLGRIWFEIGATQQYYPIAHSAFWVMHRLWGDATLGYHLVNIVLHACSAFLVFVILRRLAVPGALFAAGVFAVHPVHVESVAWMTELKNTLSGAWYLSACLAYLHFDAGRTRRAYGLAAALFALALLTKTVTATLPAALLVVFWWQRGRLRWREDVVPLVPFFVLGIGGGWLTAWVERTQIGAEGAAFQFTLLERCLIAGRAFWFYLAKLVWPANLVFIYPRWHVSQEIWWQFLYPLALAALLIVLWIGRARARAPLAAMLFFVGTLGPALGFVNVYPFLYSFVADHFQYLASLGPIALFSAGAARLAGRWRPALGSSDASPAVLAAALLVVLPLGALSWSQSRQYIDAETLYRTTLARNPACWMAHINLGKLMQERARAAGDPRLLEGVVTEFQAAIAIEPGVSQAHNNLGTVLFTLGRLDQAVAEYREALRIKPGDAEVHANLSLALQRMGRSDEAAAEAQASLKIRPDQSGAHSSLGEAWQSMGRLDEAIAEYMESLRLAPDDAETHNNLGSALARRGRLDEAVVQFQEALRLNPHLAAASTNFGSALVHMGRLDEAARRFEDAIAMQPASATAHYNLANVLYTMGRRDEAIAAYRETLKYQPDFAEAHNELGIALAELGRFPDAVTHFREALRLKPGFADAQANLARALAMIKDAPDAGRAS